MAVSKHIAFTLVFIISLSSFNELVAVSSGETNPYFKLSLGQNQTGPEAIAFDCKGEDPYVGIFDGRILKWQGHHIGWPTFAVTAPNRYVKLPLGQNQTGPEAIAFDCKGEGPYIGISDGRILKWQGHHIGWTTYAVTAPNRADSCDGVDGIPKEKECGRPLGMRFDMRTCELYIADSSFGLMKVGPNGGVASPIMVNGNPFLFLNSLDIDFVNNAIYFSESSTNYPHWEGGEAISTGDKSGRLMKYDMKTGVVTVLLTGLSFANGVSLSKDNDFVLVAETTANQTLKYWLKGYIAGSHEVIQLNGRPDNINRDAKGDFWIAVQLGKSVRINHLGEILETLNGDEIVNPTDVSEFHNRLWFGFIDHPYIYHT